LTVGAKDGGLFVRRVLELEQPDREAVDEDHEVRPALPSVLLDGELVDGEPVVGIWIVKVDDPRLRIANRAAAIAVLDVDPLDQKLMKALVVEDEIGRIVNGNFPQRIAES
jgi:hypothetical protein